MNARLLPIRNLLRRPGRTLALALLTAFLSMSVFGGSAVVLALRRGLTSLEERLGADIIVVPREAKTRMDFEHILLQGTTGAFYMDAAILQKISALEGVEKAAPQTFLATLKADCCSSKLQVIGIDQEADFSVQPWIAQSSGRTLDEMEIMVGSGISAGVGGALRIYNVTCPVVAQLSPTGTGLDTAVYCSMETMRALLRAAEGMGVSHKVTSSTSDNVISAVYVKVRSGESVEGVCDRINSHPSWKVATVQTKGMITDVADGLAGASHAITALIAAVWALAFVVLLISFAMIVNERKREFAVLRLIGTTKNMLAGLILRETVLCSLVGALAGIATGALLLFPFTDLIESRLALPYLTPDAGTLALLALAALLGTVLIGALSSVVAARRLSRVDPGSVLREGS